jgi:hypothetical protein
MAFTSQSYQDALTIEAIRQQLVKVVGLDSDYVRLVATPDYQVTQEERMLCLLPFGRRPDPNAGAGRRARPSSRTLRVYMHFRDSTDFAGDDRLLIQEVFDFEDSVIDALDDFWPLDDDDNPLTIEPLHILPSPSGEITRQAINDIGMCRCWVDFEWRSIQRNQTPQP